MIVAVVPMKPLAQAKRRLAGVLSEEDRRRLVTTMLGEVLDRLAACRLLAQRYMVTADPDVAALAEAHGACVLAEAQPCGLDAAVRNAAAMTGKHGALTMLYIPGDVPLTEAEEIDAIIAERSRSRMVAVPSHDGQGTNALLLSPPGAIEPSFGPGSFARHLEVGRQAGLQPTTLALEGVGRDIDTPADLEILANARAGDPRYAFLEADRIEQSLRTRAAG